MSFFCPCLRPLTSSSGCPVRPTTASSACSSGSRPREHAGGGAQCAAASSTHPRVHREAGALSRPRMSHVGELCPNGASKLRPRRRRRAPQQPDLANAARVLPPPSARPSEAAPAGADGHGHLWSRPMHRRYRSRSIVIACSGGEVRGASGG
jgi:hypothetical protein